VNVCRGGPGLGSISPAQSDYHQSTRGGGHGDYRTICLAPSSVQEAADLTHRAFEMADKYLNPVILLSDGVIGQMMEPVEFKHEIPEKCVIRSGALGYAADRPSKAIHSFYIDPSEVEELNWSLFRRYEQVSKEADYETYMVKDAKLIVAAFGVSARIAKGAIKQARANGLKVGLFRPITLWPFPEKALREMLNYTRYFLDFEMNMGQMIDDLKLSLEGRGDISFYGRPGGVVPNPTEILRVITRIYYQKGLK
jgi:2-oxoglutarate/2-oxoacid ferredoxin oxidoreductase subunit alpha